MTAPYVPRDLLAAAFPGNPRLVYAMEQQALAVAENADATANVATTANDATELAQSARDEAEQRQAGSAVLDELSKLDMIPGIIERVGTGEFIARELDTSSGASLLTQFRSDQVYIRLPTAAPTVAAVTATHTIPVVIAGVTYQLLLKA